MLELSQRFRLDLADALAGHRELLADFWAATLRNGNLEVNTRQRPEKDHGKL